MPSKRDYYNALGIQRNATEEEVRKAFRRKALEFHPDRNKDPDAAELFKEVNEAYQVLTDPERRAQYDRFGHAGAGAGIGGGGFGRGFDADDFIGGVGSVFDAFFGGGTAAGAGHPPGVASSASRRSPPAPASPSSFRRSAVAPPSAISTTTAIPTW